MANLVEGNGERVRRGGDERGGRRRYDPLAEDRSHAGQPAFEVVILDAGDQPAVRVIRERRQVGIVSPSVV